MDCYQLCDKFHSFMKARDYTRREREPLISPIFPTTFTMSGGPDLAYKFWCGDKDLLGNSVVSQPCIRHWDIDHVGDKKHLSFFDMFVTDSIKGYERHELLDHHLEFLTNEVGLDRDHFYVTYFGGGIVHGEEFQEDTEARNVWLSLGIPDDHLMPMEDRNAMEAFVANTIEPVGGPRSELFYDMRSDLSSITSIDRFLNHVENGSILELLTQVTYNLSVAWEDDGIGDPTCLFEEMDCEAVAAGFGPQRLLWILEDAHDINGISELLPLRECLFSMWHGEADRDPFNKQVAVVADHIRGLVFLIFDGILDLHGKKNRSRRYLFRKYLKNFRKNLNILPLSDRTRALEILTQKCIDGFARIFPGFQEQREFIVTNLAARYADLDTDTPE